VIEGVVGEDSRLPSGTVAFLFSDIEGSTRLWESQPSSMEAALEAHDHLVRREVASAGGRVLKHTGDGFVAVFEASSEAVVAAVAITRGLAAQDWGPCPIRVRMGIHAGVAHPREGDYFGTTITQAARVMDAGNGGQVLLSDTAASLASHGLPAGVTLADCGRHRLKDLGEPVRLWRLLIGEAEPDGRSLRTLDARPNNLPGQLSSFIGRRREIAELVDTLWRARLVTLTGVGGVGKTRLALQVAAQVLDEYADGVWVVELAALSEPQFLAQTVAAALRLPLLAGQDPLEQLHDFLAHRQVLIVLDNCEHLVDDAAKIVESLLVATEQVHVLATSREALAVSGEVRWRVPSLGIGPDDDEALGLFVDRACSVVPGFSLTGDIRGTVEAICRRLDGIPLAIELAATRLTMLSPGQIADHLDDRFRLLTGGSRTALTRRRTLLATMEWSEDLLTESERVLLRRLSVFSDGFDIDAAEAVCGHAPLSPLDVFDLLGRLVDESMVQFERDPTPRYRLLETVRAFASFRLADAGDVDDIKARHADHFEAVARRVEELMEAGPVEAAHGVAHLELANLRNAMTWSYERGRPEQGLSIAVRLRDFFHSTDSYREGLTWLRRGLDIIEPGPSAVLVRALAYAMLDADNSADFDLADELRAHAEALLPQLHDPTMLGDLNNAIGAVLLANDPRNSLSRLATAVDLYRSVGSDRWLRPEGNRLWGVSYTGDLSDLEAHIECLHEAERSRGRVHLGAGVLEAWYRVVAGQPEAAALALERVVSTPTLGSGVWFRWAKAESLRQLGRLSECEEELAEIRATYGSLVHLSDYQFLPVTGAWLALERSELTLALGRWEPAARWAEHPTQRVWRAATATFHGVIAVQRGEWDRAACLLGFAAAEAERCGYQPFVYDRPRVEAARARLRVVLGDDGVSEALARQARAEYDRLPLYRPSSPVHPQ
jgi:predicted ATPase/class 3 adenylate cyclase